MRVGVEEYHAREKEKIKKKIRISRTTMAKGKMP
jgi:hypothetical protein